MHPTPDKFRKVMDFYSLYPEVGLIIISGPGKDEENFHKLGQNKEGLYFLLKPYTTEEFFRSIEFVTKQARLKK